MSGHSKWATIKRKKEATDNKRGKIFTKIGRELAVAVKMGGADINMNSRLRDVVAKAKANNMPNDNIMRAIKKAAGEGSGVNYEDMVYEGYGVAGVAVIVEALTDNKNRTAGEVRHAFDKNGGSLGATGCVSWMFDRKGQIVIESEDGEIDEEELMMCALDAGAEDFSGEEGVYEIITAPEDFTTVCDALSGAGYTFASAETTLIPQTTVELNEEQRSKVEKMIDMLEDNDDVQNVYHNAELDEE